MNKKNIADKIQDLRNWERIGEDWEGIYRFPITKNFTYRIEMEFHSFDTPIETAVATLYEIRKFDVIESRFVERKTLAKSVSVRECLDTAYAEMLKWWK